MAGTRLLGNQVMLKLLLNFYSVLALYVLVRSGLAFSVPVLFIDALSFLSLAALPFSVLTLMFYLYSRSFAHSFALSVLLTHSLFLFCSLIPNTNPSPCYTRCILLDQTWPPVTRLSVTVPWYLALSCLSCTINIMNFASHTTPNEKGTLFTGPIISE